MHIESDMKTEEVKFQITQLKEIGYYYYEPIEFIKSNKIEQLEVGININYRWNLDQDIFGVQLDIAYLLELLENKKEELLKFSTYTEFKVVPLKEIFKVNAPNDFTMDANHETTFVSIAISSTRGMLASRTAGTFFSQFIFPIVTPSDLILTKKIQSQKILQPKSDTKTVKDSRKTVRK